MIFATHAISYQVLSNFKMSCDSVSTILFSNQRDQFIEDGHIFDINIAATGGKATGVDPVHISKVWSTDLNTAERTIEVTTQLKQQDGGGGLSRNFSTNNRIL